MSMQKLGPYLAAASVALVMSMSGSYVKADDAPDSRIVGTWIGTGTVETPPGTSPFIFTDLAAINPGGTLTETNGAFNWHSSENPFLPPPLTVDYGEGYGVWKQLNDSRRFAFTFQRLLFAGANTPTTVYGRFFPGQHIGVATIESVLELSASDGLKGTFTFQLTNLSGDVVFAGKGTISFTRLKIQQPE